MTDNPIPSPAPSGAVEQAPPRRGRGRPRGSKTRVAAEMVLRLHHFQFVRAALELPLRSAWERYLAFAGGIDDERHFASQLRNLVGQIRHAAHQRGLGAIAEVALHGHATRGGTASRGGTPSVPAWPSLEEWIQERCERLGVEADFQTQAEWLAEYQQAFGLDQLPVPAPATVSVPTAAPPDSRASVAAQLAALHRLSGELARPPALDDPVAGWLAPALSAALATQGVVSLSDLIDFFNVHRFRWFERVPRIGRERAARIAAWLHPVAEQLGKPLRAQALHPPSALALARSGSLSVFDARSLLRFAVVPLDRLAVPPELSGRQGRFRLHAPNVFDADDDLAAIQAWLQRHVMSPRTFEAYGREAERFYLWCLHVARKPLSSVAEGDLHAYRAFIEKPPLDWVQPRKTERASDDWRPFRGPLSPASQMRSLTVVSAMLSALADGGYLSANAARGVRPFVKLPRTTINVRRSFTDAQWHWLMTVLARQPDSPFTRRTRLILELGATSGLRLIEMATARMGALRREVIDGVAVWMLDVLGKGNRRRSVVILDDVKALIDRHQADMQAAALGYNAAVHRVRVLLSERGPGTAAPEQRDRNDSPDLRGDAPDPAMRPLIGVLKRPPPRLVADADGQPAWARETQADRYGALDPTALYQALKRFFRLAAEQAGEAGLENADGLEEADVAALSEASTHWLRHFFANSAAADDVQPTVLMHAMGHADLRTTSLYTRPEVRQMVRELTKVRRRR